MYWREERDSWERERHQKVSKENFLEIYARAWIRAATPDIIKAAFSKTGVWPVNRAAIAPELMAPSRETAHEGALPFVPPTPVRAVAKAMAMASRPRRHHPRTPSIHSPSAHTTEPEYDEDVLIAAWRTRDTLGASSLSFLMTTSPIRSTAHLPDFNHPPSSLVPPLTIFPSTGTPQSDTVRVLRAENAALQARIAEDRTLVNDQRAMILLQTRYCESVRQQLETAEKKKDDPARGGKLVGDGMPKVLTSADFVARVQEHTAAQAAQEAEKERRQGERDTYGVALAEWRKAETARKEENVRIKEQWVAAVAEWQEEREKASEEGRRAGWTKPKRGPLIRPIPRPRIAARDNEEEEEGEAAADGDVEAEAEAVEEDEDEDAEMPGSEDDE